MRKLQRFLYPLQIFPHGSSFMKSKLSPSRIKMLNTPINFLLKPSKDKFGVVTFILRYCPLWLIIIAYRELT